MKRSREHTCPCRRVCTLRCRCDALSGWSNSALTRRKYAAGLVASQLWLIRPHCRSVSRPTLVKYGRLEVFVIVLETTASGKQWAQGCSSASLPPSNWTGPMWRLRRQQSASQTENESINLHMEVRWPSWSIACMWWWTVLYAGLTRLWWQLPKK